MHSIIKSMCKALVTFLSLGSPLVFADSHYLNIAESLCANPQIANPLLEDYQREESEIVVRGSRLGTEYNFRSETLHIKFEVIEPPGRPRRSALTTNTIDGNLSKPVLRLVLSNECELTQAQRINYEDDAAIYIEPLDESLAPLPDKIWLNPPLPQDTGRSDGLRVALIDSGVNYTLPEIANALALDEHGKLIGYDFWDQDSTPYDANPARSPFFVQRHGTRTASILLREAPDIALVPYRYPRPDMTRMAQLIEHAASHSVRIIGMPLGSNNYKEWLAFGEAASAHPEILFIVSAGNNGRDIDINPVYPAALEHDNILVVTSSDDFIHPAERTNFGKISVDYLVPAENIDATDYNGSAISVSGSSYAVSRITALAARLLTKNSDQSISELKENIDRFSIKGNTGRHVYKGYIGDPLADTSQLGIIKDDTFTIQTSTTKNTLALNIVALDPGWTNSRIRQAVSEANTIYAQCDLQLTTDSVLRTEATGYLAFQSPGHALQLHRQLLPLLQPEIPTIYLATDTHMQTKFDAEAFGLANTNNRPWMKNSVWITVTTKDTGHALAHELFHVMANRGDHSNMANNLMQTRTALSNTLLTQEQCQLAINTAVSNGLLKQ